MMKVAILAGGLGTRLSEETIIRPKPMVEIGGRPILWHIMKGYAAHGFDEFVIALGYKGEIIKDYFVNYFYRSRNLSVDLKSGKIQTHNEASENWTVHLLDTGLNTQTGGRIRQIRDFIGDEPFMMTYGDGVSNINIQKLLEFHRSHKKLVTITAVRPPARFGQIVFEGEQVARFDEKPQIGEGWINGGFFVIEPRAADFIDGDDTVWERGSLQRLSTEGQLVAYQHEDFWHCMDTIRDVYALEDYWQKGTAPWKTWP